ncbi:MAG: hypothetical protein AVDCRST_MAG19-1864 [uncultured Thermomicrobiales bacterium]|uniref:Adenylate kinase n=1 Tax=uncultured Thermomicrobiales bacterium TaxID=1645740 RepID=A0A6J4UYQ0_9BACT|nr:MAG: hypothetical protein AVDCRST_MAG19-1864 [uncultured Thermomicrobiales bacterium]
MTIHRPAWSVLLPGGPSGAGKSEAAAIGRRLGVSWLQVDDLRLALQQSGAVLPRGTAELRIFLDTPRLWRLPPERLRDALIGVGAAVGPAIEIVVANHVDTDAPVVMERDGILPSLLDRPPVRERMEAMRVRAAFLVEPDEAVLYANMVARERGIADRSAASLRTEARANWLFGRWLEGEARRSVPVLEPRPWETLPDRLLAPDGARGGVADRAGSPSGFGARPR